MLTNNDYFIRTIRTIRVQANRNREDPSCTGKNRKILPVLPSCLVISIVVDKTKNHENSHASGGWVSFVLTCWTKLLDC